MKSHQIKKKIYTRNRHKKKVLVFGTFDLFHKGHEFFLKQAKKYGNWLVVIVARDKNVKKLKGFFPQDNEKKRLQNIQEYKVVNEANLGYESWGDHFHVLQDINPDVVCFGYDQEADIPEGKWKVVNLPAYKPEIYKSSKLRK